MPVLSKLWMGEFVVCQKWLQGRPLYFDPSISPPHIQIKEKDENLNATMEWKKGDRFFPWVACGIGKEQKVCRLDHQSSTGFIAVVYKLLWQVQGEIYRCDV